MKALHEIIKDNHIIVISRHIDNCKGCYIKYKNLNIITLEPTLTPKERKEVLIHEVKHFLLSATYSINETNADIIDMIESKVDRFCLNSAKYTHDKTMAKYDK